MPNDLGWLPLFPLKTVLFPDGILPLRIFETRYIDMVRDCMKTGAPFGVALIRNGQEVGAAAEPEPVGCLARITDWDMQELGVMHLRVQGGERFRVLETRVRADQRLEARVEAIEPDPEIPVSDIHVRCAKTLKIVIDDIESRARAAQDGEFVSPFAYPIRLDSAAWVANRWCEILPIPLKARQKLLELEDPGARLSLVYQYLQQHKII
ncbi:MAG TPA: LON peptidase substrate-binding domain-containing protein [Noviherbaspirillum sp.]|nr:LON peptidase substrate-binding domain-containing protein [Noviherbaspirillum sp.]